VAMTAEERDRFLETERTCRLATVGRDGTPHVTPLWFVWDGRALWLNTLVRSQRWTDFQHNRRVGVVVDAGNDYFELRGVELTGSVEIVGPVPRGSEVEAELADPERLFGEKYAGGRFVPDGKHAWARIMPEKCVSWDFSKFGTTGG
jgi:hypothetical protein